jgi:hypothetical protein
MVALVSNRMYIGPSTEGSGGAERRMFPRKEINVRIEGKRLDHTVDARQMPHLSLALKDISLGGLAAVTNYPVARGERITVFFPPEGPARGWDAYGRVVRCDASPAGGYRIGVAFDPLPAA